MRRKDNSSPLRLDLAPVQDRQRLVVALARTFLLFFSLHASLALARGSDAESIRSFLSNPKPIEYYLYQVTADANFHLEGENSSTGVPQKTTILRGRWKSDSMNWSQLLSSTNISPEERFGILGGRMGGLLWTAHFGDLTLCQEDSNPTKKEPILLFANGGRFQAHRILRLGLPEVEFPTAIWKGLSFEASAIRNRSTKFEVSRRVNGQIAERGPNQIEISVTNLETGDLESKVLLTYPAPFSEDSFPTGMEVLERIKEKDSAARERITRVRIVEFRRPSGDLAAELFHPEKMGEVGRKATAFYSNDTLYGITPAASAGQKPKAYKMITTQEARKLKPGKAQNSLSTFFRVTLVLVCAIPLALLGWQALKNKQQPKE